LRSVLAAAQLPASAAVLDAQVALLREGFDSRPLANTLAGTVMALAPDSLLEQHVSAAAAAANAAGSEHLGDTGALQQLLALRQQVPLAEKVQKRLEEVIGARRLALHQAEMLLAEPRREAMDRDKQAAERKAQIEEEMNRAVAAALPADRKAQLHDASLALEDEVNMLQGRLKELRGQVDDVSHQIVEVRERQRAHMAQEDGLRRDLDDVKSKVGASQLETASELEKLQMRRAFCSNLVDAVQAAQPGVADMSSDADAAAEALREKAEEDIHEAILGQRRAADERLAAAMAVGRTWCEEDARAAKPFEILGVEVPDSELPTRRERVHVLNLLNDAWEDRRRVGGVEPEQCTAVAALIAQVTPAGGLPCPPGQSPKSGGRGGLHQGPAPDALKAQMPRRPSAGSADGGDVVHGALRMPPQLGHFDLDASTPLTTPISSPIGASRPSDVIFPASELLGKGSGPHC